MKTRILLASTLLLGTAVAALAAGADDFHLADRLGLAAHSHAASAERGEARVRVADKDHGRKDHHERKRHHDDDEDDDDEGGAMGAVSPTGPTDPSAPVPDNGLFNGKARPKVEVK